MKTRLITLAAMVAFLAPTTPAQRKAEITRVGTDVQIRITEPNGVDHYLVFQGQGITGAVEIPATLAGCADPVFITLGPVAAHNHFHTVVWVDCKGTQHRWMLPVPWNWQWLPGSAVATRSPVGFGCGMSAPLGLDLDGPPSLGCVRDFVLTNVPASTVFTAVYCSTALASPAPSLAAFGLQASECFAFIDLNGALLAGAGAGASATFPVVIPAWPWLEGCLLHAQAITLSPGENPAGLVTSNGLSMVMADYWF